MCKRSTMLGWLLLGLTGCGADTGGNLSAYDSGGFGDAGSAGYSSAGRGLASETTGGSTSSGSYCPACTVCEANPAPKCVTGTQSACTCTDGSSGAQVCQGDGTMGACECEAAVETFPECFGMGFLMQTSCGAPNPYAYINCKINPNPDACVPMKTTASYPGINGLCCSVVL